MLKPLIVVGILLGALLLAGCGSSKTASRTTTAGVGEPACAPLTNGTAALSGGHPSGTMLLTDLGTAREPCADRVAFDFKADLAETPGYRVEYRPAAQAQTEDGSGQHIAIDGAAFLVVRLEPAATADLSGEQLTFTYKGPRRLAGDGTRYVREVVKTGDFESVLTWTIGLSEKRPFAVITSASPPRLTIEIG
jgi:hypothetical protein